MSDPRDRERAAFRSALGRTPECPPIEALENTADPAIQSHVASCTHCRAELAMLQEFEAAEPRAEEQADLLWVKSELQQRASQIVASEASPRSIRASHVSPAPRAKRAWLPSFLTPKSLTLAGATLAVLLAAGLYFQQPDQPAAPGPAPIWRSEQFAALSPAGDLSQAPAEFRWEAVAGATSYHLELLEVDGTVVWSNATTQTTVEIPNNVRAKLTPGRAFQWRVVAENATGARIASSHLQTFHILATIR